MLSNTFKKWLQRFLPDEESILLLVIILMSTITLIYFGYLFAPLFISIVIAFLMQGLVRQLEKYHVPHLLAVIIVFSGFTAFFLMLLLFILPLIWQQLLNLLNETSAIVVTVEAFFNRIAIKYPEFLSSDLINQVTSSLSTLASDAGQWLVALSLKSINSIFTVIIYSVIVPIFVFFLLKDSDIFIAQLSRLLPEKRTLLSNIWVKMEKQLASYIRGKAIEMVMVGIVSYIAFKLIGLNFAELLAIAIGISVIIPYVGATVVTIPVIMVAYLQWGIASEFWWVMIAHFTIQIVEGNILVPLLFSEALNMHPATILLAIIVFGNLWGILGVFFAIPLATLIKVIWCTWPGHETKENKATMEGKTA